jgi:protein ImuB
MFAALWLPRFHLQALLRVRPPVRDAAIAVLDRTESAAKGTSPSDDARLICVSEAAERAGVFTGMTASQAQARCERLRLVYREEKEERAAHDLLLECAEGWTPNFESTSPDLCVLDLSRVGKWERRRPAGDISNDCHRRDAGAPLDEHCGGQIRAHLNDRRLDVRVGFAANVDLATLAAFAADPLLIIRENTRDEENVLHRLPVFVLRPSPEIREVLGSWGIRTLGEFVKLRRQDIAERLGREGALLWDLAVGNRERLLRLIRPAASHSEEHDLDYPVECLDPLLFLLRSVLDRLCIRLANAWLVAASLLLTLRFNDGTRHHRELRIAEPTRDAGVLFRVLHSHLDGLTASAPVVGVALEIRPIRAASSQTLLFEKSLRDPNRFAETLSQIEAMLGAGRVGRAVLIPRHRPDSFHIAGFLEPHETDARLALMPPPDNGLPLRRLRPAPVVSVLCTDGTPAVLHTRGKAVALTQNSGPWLLSGDWWDAQNWRHEVWESADADGTLYRLVRQNETWSLDGVYG